MKEFINFFKNRTVQKQILFAFGGLFLFIILMFLVLRVYTRHGQALSVPDFSRLTLEEVSRLADEKSLRYEVIDSVYIQGEAPGSVVAQTPSPNTKVKANRTIFITINAIKPEKIDMPNLINLPVRQAEAIIQTNGLHIGYKKYVPNMAKDYVLKQFYHNREVSAGTKVIKGSNIDLVVGMGLGNSETAVPNLKGLTREAAQDALSSHYLNFGAIIYDISIESRQDSLNAIVWKQKPAYGSSLSTGGSIDVWLTVNNSKAASDSIPNKHE